MLKPKDPREIHREVEENNKLFIDKLHIYLKNRFYYGLKQYILLYEGNLIHQILDDYEKIDNSDLQYDFPNSRTLILYFLRISLNNIIKHDDSEFLEFFMKKVYSPFKDEGCTLSFQSFIEEEYAKCVRENKIEMSKILKQYLRAQIYIHDYDSTDLIL